MKMNTTRNRHTEAKTHRIEAYSSLVTKQDFPWRLPLLRRTFRGVTAAAFVSSLKRRAGFFLGATTFDFRAIPRALPRFSLTLSTSSSDFFFAYLAVGAPGFDADFFLVLIGLTLTLALKAPHRSSMSRLSSEEGLVFFWGVGVSVPLRTSVLSFGTLRMLRRTWTSFPAMRERRVCLRCSVEVHAFGRSLKSLEANLPNLSFAVVS